MKFFFKMLCLSMILQTLFISTLLAKVSDKQDLRIATWNLQDFGGKYLHINGVRKGKDEQVLKSIAQTIIKNDIDVIFVQEIANFDGEAPANRSQAFRRLLKHFDGEYIGKSTPIIEEDERNKEAYGVIYRSSLDMDIRVYDTRDINTIPRIEAGSYSKDKLKRPPMKAELIFNDRIITVYSSHTSPSAGSAPQSAFRELPVLEKKVESTHPNRNLENVIVLGDLNASCGGGHAKIDYSGLDNPRTPGVGKLFQENWVWRTIINDIRQGAPDNFDNVTNFAGTAGCAYDRIILSDALGHAYHGDHGLIMNIPEDADSNYDGCLFDYRDNHPTGYAIDISMCAYTEEEIFPSRDFAISDHILVYADLIFGGVETASPTGYWDKVGESCEIDGVINVFAENLKPNVNYNFHIISSDINHDDLLQDNAVTDIFPIVSISLTANDLGQVVGKTIWLPPEVGSYNLIIDIDKDNRFTYGVDLIDSLNQPGFVVKKCTPKEDAVAVTVSSPIDVPDSEPDGPPKKKIKVISPGDSLEISGVTSHNTDFVTVCILETTSWSATALFEQLKENGSFRIDHVGVSICKEFVPVNSDNSFSVALDSFAYSFSPGSGYNIIVDVNNDGFIDSDFDIIDNKNSIGFIVKDDTISHNTLISLDDNLTTRELFIRDRAKNIYAYGQELPENKAVDVYIVDKDQFEFNLGQTPLVQLSSEVAMIPPVVTMTNNTGDLFVSLTNGDFEKIFSEAYSVDFNIVVDVNRNGYYEEEIDRIDHYDLGDLSDYFIDLSEFDELYSNYEAVGEYKEFLNAKLDLEEPLSLHNDYDTSTKQASIRYACQPYLTKKIFEEWILPFATVGFRVVYEKTQIDSNGLEAGSRYSYAELQGFNANFSHDLCVTAEEFDLDGGRFDGGYFWFENGIFTGDIVNDGDESSVFNSDATQLGPGTFISGSVNFVSY